MTSVETGVRGRRERNIAIGLIAGTFVFAVVVQSQFFAFADSIRGDHFYHQGVAATMRGGNLEGGGPLPGTLSYYGGLLPLGSALGQRVLGVSYDGLLSVVSWFATLAWPAAFLVLGRRLWPGALLKQGMLVFVGTVGSSMALSSKAEWVLSILPSGSNMWPLYPRDMALVLFVLALSVAMGTPSTRRAVATGALLTVALLSQFQVGLVATAIVTAWILVGVHWPVRRDQARTAALTVGTAFVLTSWYWIPRLLAALQYRPILLHSYPGADPPNFSAAGLVNALGLTGMLAVAGIVVSWRQADRGRVEAFFLGWIVIFIPFLVLGVVVGDVGFITPRRIGLLVALPIVVFAARAAAAAVATRFGLLVLPLLVLAIAVPSFAEVVHTRHRIEKLWSDDALGYESFHHALWDPVTARLQRDVDENGTVRVLAPDNDAAYIWSESGAQPFSLWLQGVIKLGFDPRKATGTGLLERVRATQAAFASGRGGLCALARREHLDTAVLRGAEGLIAYHDLRPSARWRVSPMARSDRSISRTVAPRVRYEDRNVSEQVWLTGGAQLPLGFSGDGIRIVDIEASGGGAEVPPALFLQHPDGATVLPEVQIRGLTTTYRFRTPDGVPAHTQIFATSFVRVSRVLGYEPSGSPSIVAPRGATPRPVIIPSATLCRLGGS